MNTSNLDDCTDSEILNTGFADFVKNQQQQCRDNDCVELEGPQSSEMSSPAALSVRSSGLKSVVPLAVSNTERAVDDVGFNRFLDEWTLRWSQEAKHHWNKMSKRDRAMFAPVS
ncbi:hypothetical protein KR054_007850 [Drosophila jambulina]|nr:hypothetical protein KR054_007850 [Drosophila jambulina]